MSYRELGEARVLKRYASKPKLLAPAHGQVAQPQPSENWQSLEDTSVRFLHSVKSARRPVSQ